MHRLLAIIKKDFIWCFSSKSLFLGLLLVPVVVLFLMSLQLIPFIILYFFDDTDFLSLIIKQFVLFYISSLGFLDIVQSIAIIMVVFLIGINFTQSMFWQEKSQGTLLALLTTPLKSIEFVIGKIFLTFSVCVLFSMFCIFMNIILDSKNVFMLNGFVLLNLNLFIATMCLWGCFIGLWIEVPSDQTKVLFFIYPFLMFYLSSITPFFLYQGFQLMEWQNIALYTVFHVLCFVMTLYFVANYTRFYFSYNKEKRFSLPLFFNLCIVVGLHLWLFVVFNLIMD